jgi:ubiquitin C-terminal hydrolase
MKVAGSAKKTMFVLRGMICYYGRHYWAYFYSEQHDVWFQFNDETLRKVGCFQDVIDKSVKSKAIPRILFYEQEEAIEAILTQNHKQLRSKKEFKLYYSEQ